MPGGSASDVETQADIDALVLNEDYCDTGQTTTLDGPTHDCGEVDDCAEDKLCDTELEGSSYIDYQGYVLADLVDSTGSDTNQDEYGYAFDPMDDWSADQGRYCTIFVSDYTDDCAFIIMDLSGGIYWKYYEPTWAGFASCAYYYPNYIGCCDYLWADPDVSPRPTKLVADGVTPQALNIYGNNCDTAWTDCGGDTSIIPLDVSDCSPETFRICQDYFNGTGFDEYSLPSSSSSGSRTHGPINATDGSTSTFWRALDDTNPWIGIDLGSAQKVLSVTIAQEYDTGSNSTSSIDLEYSDNAIDWSTAKSGLVPECFYCEQAGGHTKAFMADTPDVGSHRYWRIITSDSIYWEVEEFKVAGCVVS